MSLRLALSFAVLASLSSLAHADAAPAFADSGDVALNRAEVRAALAAERDENLAAFHAYRIAKIYPSNVFTADERNVWRDQDGHLCAAATIIDKSGATELVARTANDNNFIQLVAVHDGELFDWMLASGFTQEELVLIQRPFRPVVEKPVAEPPGKIAINARMKKAETERLAKLYETIEAKLVKQTEHSLDVATERVMRRPELARALIGA